MSKEDMFREFYNLLMRSNYENGLCEKDSQRYEYLKSRLLDNGDKTPSYE